MELYKRQQFEFLLQTAVERLTERLEQRHSGSERALVSIADGSCLNEVQEFVTALFRDFLLDNVDGACFVLGALSQRRAESPITMNADQTVENFMTNLARLHFQRLLLAKTSELLEQHSRYQPLEVGGPTQ